ncbi:ABC-type proline/glycine betaine transport system permease subunit [Streptosporangium album]|uniref:ABC-type proline/glycine betaine transport system permease subunit n=1 Tax=Streptosporangium album TaxID=47479 RepID=A0A7W7WE27_9ACTN|nr:ABC transporter permease [Streptosporangium album]MBB4943726.1 ABC-type proline/glycine betaine transport system permease subunit [Streptosporangium album]
MTAETVAVGRVRPAGGALGLRHLITPLAVCAALAALYAWVGTLELDSIERRSLNRTVILTKAVEHIQLTLVATALVLVIAIPLGIVASRARNRLITPVILTAANLGQAIPCIGLLVLCTFLMGVGFQTALVGLVAYAVLPVLRNTMIGVQQVDPTLIEAARGMGMTRGQILRRVELKLAVPAILAGLRTALVLTVGVATLGAFVAAGGFGELIINGLKLNRMPVTVVGAVLTACIAFAVDWLGALAENLLKPRGM